MDISHHIRGLNRLLYTCVVIGGSVGFAWWGYHLEGAEGEIAQSSTAWLLWSASAHAFFGILTYPAGILGLISWVLWAQGIATPSEAVFLQGLVSAAVGVTQWYVVLPNVLRRAAEPGNQAGGFQQGMPTSSHPSGQTPSLMNFNITPAAEEEQWQPVLAKKG